MVVFWEDLFCLLCAGGVYGLRGAGIVPDRKAWACDCDSSLAYMLCV